MAFAKGHFGHVPQYKSCAYCRQSIKSALMKLEGIVPPIGTPLTSGDQVDVAGLQRLAAYLVDAGVHGILANGTMGGFAFLPDDQQLRSISTTVDAVNRRVPVIGGLGETSTVRAVKMAKRIAAEGVDALSLLPPFYYYATQEHLLAYFSDIASAIDLPLFLYDNPVMTKNHIHPETVAKLRDRIPHLAGIKVSNQDFANLQTLVELMRADTGFSILTGSEFLIVAALQMGCQALSGDCTISVRTLRWNSTKRFVLVISKPRGQDSKR